MALPEVGDEITYLAGKGRFLRATQVSKSQTQHMVDLDDRLLRMDGQILRESEEGKVWIRGFHGRDTDEGKALLVAYTLYRGPDNPSLYDFLKREYSKEQGGG